MSTLTTSACNARGLPVRPSLHNEILNNKKSLLKFRRLPEGTPVAEIAEVAVRGKAVKFARGKSSKRGNRSCRNGGPAGR
jgi:hypothetical protein